MGHYEVMDTDLSIHSSADRIRDGRSRGYPIISILVGFDTTQEERDRLCRMQSEPYDPNQPVGIYTSPWVSGTRAAAYYGPIHTEFLAPPGTEDIMIQVDEALKAKALELGANSVVGVEVTLDPFPEGQEGVMVRAVGTAAKLEPLF
jgi:hypothetical protein